MKLDWRVFLAFTAVLIAVPARSAQDAPSPPTLEDAQAAYARHAAKVLSRLVKDGAPVQLTEAQLLAINQFSRRLVLRGCDDWRPPDPDPFAPADKPAPPVVFNCTWESGERISLTFVANTGSWTVSEDSIAAAGAGYLLTGPKQEQQKIVAVPTAPIKAAAEDPPPPAPQATASAVTPPSVLSGTNMTAMPNPFVPPARVEPARPTTPPPAAAGPMPTPFSSGAK